METFTDTNGREFEVTKQIHVDGQTYNVLAEKPFVHNGAARKMLTVKKPRGRREYFAIVYENGVTKVILT